MENFQQKILDLIIQRNKFQSSSFNEIIIACNNNSVNSSEELNIKLKSRNLTLEREMILLKATSG